jgi:cytochrome P450
MLAASDDQLSLSNLLQPEIRADPYPLYHKIQSEDPVHWDAPMGFWVITRYDDVMSTLHDRRFSKAAGLTTAMNRLPETELEKAKSLYRAFSKQMLFADPPYHTHLRGLVNKAFTPRVVEQMQPHIQQIAYGLLDAVQDRHRMDVIRDFAYPLPMTVIIEMLGLPTTDSAQLKQWSDEFAASFGIVRRSPAVMQQATIGLGEFTDYLWSRYDDLEANPKDDLLSALVAAVEQGNRLDNEEWVANVLIVLVGGHETTTNLIGNGLLALLHHPEQMEELRADPALIHPAIEEMLRYDTPVQIVWRVATEDVEIGGKQIRTGQLVNLIIGAANRDPAQFDAPDRFDIHRPEHRHVSFGLGIHFCLGSPLGRLDGQIALATLLQRLPNLKLESDTFEWQEAPTFRGVKSLPVAF